MRDARYRLFHPFRLDPINEQLWRGDEAITLRRKSFEVLRYLVERPGQLVTKYALLDVIWQRVAVSDSMPAVCVAELRKALKDVGKPPRFIETVHGRGYRFIAPVVRADSDQPVESPSAAAPAENLMVGRSEELRCPACKTANHADAQFCDSCGQPFAASSRAVAATSALDDLGDAGNAAREQIDGERKIVTALFADLEGSTELMEDLDPEEARAIVEPALLLMAEAVQRYQGYLVRTTGDGIFALFGAPAACEDHPQRALYAALAMQKAMCAYRQGRIAQRLPALEARVGVHTGEVVAYSVETSGKLEYRLIGHTANLASRLEALAPAGSIAISESTRNLCEGYFELRELGPRTVKGLSEPINVYEVIGPGPLRSHFELAARRGLTKFIGRERELEQVRRALDLATSGHGQIVAVVAEAGTGKSRLFYEFKATLPSDWKVLEVSTVSHGKASAYLPVIDLFKVHFDIKDQDDPTTRREKIAAALSASDGSAADLPSIYGLLGILEGADPLTGLHPQVRRRRTLEALKRILLGESLKQPVAVIFENLHWVDRKSQAFLDLLVDGIISARVLLLVSYRPEYRHEWVNRAHYTQVRLDPLDSEGASQMLDALLGPQPELGPVRATIIEKTGGNPFFIEELVRALFEQGVLLRNGKVSLGRWSKFRSMSGVS